MRLLMLVEINKKRVLIMQTSSEFITRIIKRQSTYAVYTSSKTL